MNRNREKLLNELGEEVVRIAEGDEIPSGDYPGIPMLIWAERWQERLENNICAEEENASSEEARLAPEQHPTVEVGQVWKANDKRDGGKRKTVLAIEGEKAVCQSGSERKVRIALYRFDQDHHTGYTLIQR